MTKILLRITPPILAAILVIPIYLLFLDRDPPFIRLQGSIVPDVARIGDYIAVRYVTTKRNLNRDCPGVLQQEFVDSAGNQHSKAVREAGPLRWQPDPDNPNQEIFDGHPVQVPTGLVPGRVRFRTATFRHCNGLQWFMRWPLTQVGPDLYFTLIPNGAEQRQKQ
jgi:hypothetical protein